jgi:hypothetical protein
MLLIILHRRDFPSISPVWHCFKFSPLSLFAYASNIPVCTPLVCSYSPRHCSLPPSIVLLCRQLRLQQISLPFYSTQFGFPFPRYFPLLFVVTVLLYFTYPRIASRRPSTCVLRCLLFSPLFSKMLRASCKIYFKPSHQSCYVISSRFFF